MRDHTNLHTHTHTPTHFIHRKTISIGCDDSTNQTSRQLMIYKRMQIK